MPAFTDVWRNHPKIQGDPPLPTPATYPNQCAINLHPALSRSGFNTKTFTGTLSWQKDKPKYAIRGQEIPNWLASPGILQASVHKFSGKEASDNTPAKSGIAVFQNHWCPNEQGNHIDPWNASRLTDWTSWIRIQAGINIPGVWSDDNKVKAVWF